MSQPFYVTTAISYPNGPPHIGHAYEAVATDALARFRRLQGRDVFFLTGTDEHGIKMLQMAKAQGITPAELAVLRGEFERMAAVLIDAGAPEPPDRDLPWADEEIIEADPEPAEVFRFEYAPRRAA